MPLVPPHSFRAFCLRATLLFAALLFLAAPTRSQAAPAISYTDSWFDSITGDTNDGFSVVTAGSFTVNISLPLNGVDITQFNPSSSINLTIGGNDLLDGSLGDDPHYTAGKRSASFPIQDDNGNPLGNFVVSWTSAAMTISGTLHDDALGDDPNNSGNSNYGSPGTAGVTHISDTNEVDVTLDAFTYTATNVMVTGQNNDIETAGPDQAGYSLERGSIKASLPIPPILAVTSPVNSASIQSYPPVVTFHGTLSDKYGVNSIWCLINNDTNGGPIELADFTTNQSGVLPKSGSWSSALDLSQAPGSAVGPNTLLIYAISSSGESSPPVTRKVTWVEATTVSVSVNPAGAGTITGVRNGQSVIIGDAYHVKAAPSNTKLWAFLDWTDNASNLLSSTAAFVFTPSTNEAPASLVANFVPNPYPLAAGTYDGLFGDPSNPSPTNSGSLTLKVTSLGAFSGSLMFESRTARPFSGQLLLEPDFGPDDPGAYGSASVAISKTKILDLEFGLFGLAGGLTPSLNGTVSLADLKAGRNLETNIPLTTVLVANSGPGAGFYNFVLPPIAADPSQGPGGYSFGTATLANNGGVTVMLTLADGLTPVTSFATGVGANGAFPLYLPLYTKGGMANGMLFGWMNFTNDTSQFDGAQLDLEASNLVWSGTTPNYPNGFASPMPYVAFGARYVPPKAGTNLFGSDSVTLEVNPGYLFAEFDTLLSFNPKTSVLTVVAPNPNKVSVHLSAATGSVAGNETIQRTIVSGKGVLIPSLKAAYGFYIGTGKTDVGAGLTGPIVLVGSNSPAFQVEGLSAPFPNPGNSLTTGGP